MYKFSFFTVNSPMETTCETLVSRCERNERQNFAEAFFAPAHGKDTGTQVHTYVSYMYPISRDPELGYAHMYVGTISYVWYVYISM